MRQLRNPILSEVPPHLTFFPITEVTRLDFLCFDLDTLLLVPPAIVHPHPAAQAQGKQDTRHIASRGRG